MGDTENTTVDAVKEQIIPQFLVKCAGCGDEFYRSQFEISREEFAELAIGLGWTVQKEGVNTFMGGPCCY